MSLMSCLKSSVEETGSSQLKVSPLTVIELPFLLPKSISLPSIKREGVPVMVPRRFPMPISKDILSETCFEARSELNFSRSPLPLVTSVKYLSKSSVRSEAEASLH